MIDTKALFVIPHYGFDDQQYLKIKEILEGAGIITELASTHLAEAQGMFKNLFKPEFLVQDVEAEDFDAYIFVGGVGTQEFCQNVDVQRLIVDVLLKHKTLALVGEAVPVLFYANVLEGKNVTTLETLKGQVEAGGAYYTGMNMEQDGSLITGYDNRSIREISEAVIRTLEWDRQHKKSNF